MRNILKKAKRICGRRAKAAVSIFLVIVLVSTMLFGSVFIEAARILMIRRVVRNAANSAARSALSYYDERLASEYGLFAVEESVAEEAFRRYFQTNIRLSQNDGFDILRLSVPDNAVKVTFAKPLWDDAANANAIRSMGEYAKYRAVVNNALGLLEKLNDFFKGGDTTKKVFNAADTAKTDLQKLKDDVKKFSNEARASFHSAVETKSRKAKQDVEKALKEGRDPTPSERGFDGMNSDIDSAERTARERIEQSRQEYEDSSTRVTEEFDSASGGSVSYYDEETGTWKDSGAPATNPDDDYQIPSDYKRVEPSKDANKEKEAVSAEAQRARNQLQDKEGPINEKIEQAKECNRKIQEHQDNMTNIRHDIDTIYEPRVKDAQENANNKRNALNRLLAEKDDDPYNYQFEGALNQSYDGLLRYRDSVRELLNMLEPGSQAYRDTARELAVAEDRLTFEEELLILQELERREASSSDIQQQRRAVSDALRDLKSSCAAMGITLKHARDDEIEYAQAELDIANANLRTQQDARDDKEEEYNAEERAKNEEEAKRDQLIREIKGLYDQIPIEETTAEEWDTTYPVPKDDQDAAGEKEESFIDQILDAFGNVSVELQKTDVPSDDPGTFNKDVLKDAFSFQNMLADAFSAVDTIQDTMKFLEKVLFDQDALQEAFLFSNYVMETHTFLTSQTTRPNRHFQAGEVEYIMGNGYTSQAMCIAQTLKNIALLRLLINWIYYMGITQLPPISRIAVSLGRAAIRTLEDMQAMIFIIDKNVKSASCPLCPKLDWVKVTYSEHLYVAMLIKACDDSENGDKYEMLKRMRTMMKDTYQVQKWSEDKSPDEYLKSLQTKIEAEVTAEAGLILLNLPLFRDMLDDNGVLRDGKFVIRESVSLSY